MPVIINEVEVLAPAPEQQAASTPSATQHPGAAAPTAHQLEQLLRELDGKRMRLVAD